MNGIENSYLKISSFDRSTDQIQISLPLQNSHLAQREGDSGQLTPIRKISQDFPLRKFLEGKGEERSRLKIKKVRCFLVLWMDLDAPTERLSASFGT